MCVCMVGTQQFINLVQTAFTITKINAAEKKETLKFLLLLFVFVYVYSSR